METGALSRLRRMNRATTIAAIGRAAAASVCLLLAAGCGGGNSGNGPSPDLGAPPLQVTCLGVDLTASQPVLVSPQGEPGSCGIEGSKPCKDIGMALEVASLFGRSVAIQHGFYQTTTTIPLDNRVDIHGSCLFGGEPDQAYRTVIEASPPPGMPAVTGSKVSMTMSGLVIIGKDGSGANIAMSLTDSNVSLNSDVIVAAKGPSAAPALAQANAAPRVSDNHDVCYRPGGPASASLFGWVDLGHSAWIPGIGGQGTGGDDTGPGGLGARQGGASIAMFLVNSTATTSTTAYTRLSADSGGAGGTGQTGPSYGLGGGANSGGAGGNGGPSIGVALAGTSSWTSEPTFVYASAGGPGGTGGTAGVDPGICSADPGSPGALGGSAPVYTFVAQGLGPGESLPPGLPLYSPNYQVQLTLQTDSTLCLTSAGQQLWCTDTYGRGIPVANMQTDGNFCMYPTALPNPLPVCSGTAGNPGARLAVQNDGHVQVIDTAGTVKWSMP